MASYRAIAAVSSSLRTLLLDRMIAEPVAAVTLAPPDVELKGVAQRVNLYLMQVIENGALKNQEIPGRGHSAAYGHPPLSLDLRYLMTTHSANEDQSEADINAQNYLGDAMRVMNDFGNRIDKLTITTLAGMIGQPVLDSDLAGEFERLKIVLHPASLDELTKVWSAVSGTNFRRSVIYEVSVVQIETPQPEVRPQPVKTRRIYLTVRRRPEIMDAYVSPSAPGDPVGETRVRIGDEITIVSQGILADKLYVRLGSLEPIRVSPAGDGTVRITVPDSQYPADLDHPLPRLIPASEWLQPGPLNVQLVAMHPVEGVQGGLDRGTAIGGSRRYASNIWLMQLCPQAESAEAAPGGEVLRIKGKRLWHARARTIEVIVGDAAVSVRAPEHGDPWAAPAPDALEISLSELREVLQPSAPTNYPVAVQVDGARSRDDGVTFTLGP